MELVDCERTLLSVSAFVGLPRVLTWGEVCEFGQDSCRTIVRSSRLVGLSVKFFAYTGRTSLGDGGCWVSSVKRVGEVDSEPEESLSFDRLEHL